MCVVWYRVCKRRLYSWKYKRACTIFFAHNHFCMCNETQLWCATACAHMTTYIYNICTYIYIFWEGVSGRGRTGRAAMVVGARVVFSQRVAHEEKNKYVQRQINDRVIGFLRADKRDFVKAGVNTMNYISIYIICTIMCIHRRDGGVVSQCCRNKYI